MHTIRANLYWEFQFVLGYIAVPRSRILPEPLYGSVVVLTDVFPFLQRCPAVLLCCSALVWVALNDAFTLP